MKAFANYDKVQAASENTKLPVGGYEIMILDANIQEYTWGEILEIKFDIFEGDYKYFFTNQYNSSSVPKEDRKYKGTYRINVPKDDGTDLDEWTKRKFKRDIEAVELSNPGFKWDWDEKKLIKKRVGAIFFEKEYEYNGSRGMYTACHSFKDAAKIRSGEFTIPKPKMLIESSAASNPFAVSSDTDISDDDLPF